MANLVFSGAFSVDLASEGIRLGLVDAYGPLRDGGRVRLFLYLNRIEARADAYGLTIEISEAGAEQLARHVSVAVVRLQHLRELYRLGMLPRKMIYSDSETP